jgi:hypothetical protein
MRELIGDAIYGLLETKISKSKLRPLSSAVVNWWLQKRVLNRCISKLIQIFLSHLLRKLHRKDNMSARLGSFKVDKKHECCAIFSMRGAQIIFQEKALNSVHPFDNKVQGELPWHF